MSSSTSLTLTLILPQAAHRSVGSIMGEGVSPTIKTWFTPFVRVRHLVDVGLEKSRVLLVPGYKPLETFRAEGSGP